MNRRKGTHTLTQMTAVHATPAGEAVAATPAGVTPTTNKGQHE